MFTAGQFGCILGCLYAGTQAGRAAFIWNNVGIMEEESYIGCYYFFLELIHARSVHTILDQNKVTWAGLMAVVWRSIILL